MPKLWEREPRLREVLRKMWSPARTENSASTNKVDGSPEIRGGRVEQEPQDLPTVRRVLRRVHCAAHRVCGDLRPRWLFHQSRVPS